MPEDTEQILDISIPPSSAEVSGNGPPYAGTTSVYYGLRNRRGYDHLSAAELEELEDQKDLATTKLSYHFGFAMLFSVTADGAEISSKSLLSVVEPFLNESEQRSGVRPFLPRILFRTRYSGQGAEYPCLAVDAILYLQALGVRLIGLDTPSVDRPDETLNQALLETNDMAWIVNLNLTQARDEYPYLLAALPLLPYRIGPSPVRAVLIARPEK